MLSHPCATCGFELARIRPRRDRHYDLRLVHCPRCGRAEVRRTLGRDRIRRACAVATAILALTGQILATIFFLALIELCCGTVAADLAAGSIGYEPFQLSVVTSAILLGAWITATLSHWPAPVSWIGIAALALAVLAIEPILLPSLARLVPMWRADLSTLRMSHVNETDFSLRAAILPLFLLVAVVGRPIGLAVRTSATRRIRERRRRLVRKRRIPRALA